VTSDIVVVDIEQILDTLQDIALDPQPLVAIEQARTSIESRLQAVWDQAESLPPDQKASAQANISAAWEQAQTALAQSTQQIDMLRQAGAATAVLAGQRDRYADELSDLSEAVYDVDTDHPAVSRLADEVEQNTMQWYCDMVDEDITEAAINSLMPIDGATHTLIRRFLDRLIRQDGEWTDEQEFLLAGLLGSFVDERDAVRVRR
jgi:ElaB/YqjD/DUF883 family membrane-anchored ribosome-binding protein